MSQGTVSHYSSRNLDACTLQLKRWRPFVSSSVSDAVKDLQKPPRFADSDSSTFSTARLADSKSGAPGAGGSPSLHFGKYSLRQMMNKTVSDGEHFRWACHPLRDVPSLVDNHGPFLCDGMEIRCHHSDGADVSVEVVLPAESNGILSSRAHASVGIETIEAHQNADADMDCYNDQLPNVSTFEHARTPNDVDMVAGRSPTLGTYKVAGYVSEQTAIVKPHSTLHTSEGAKLSMFATGVSGWSKRHKQLSRALARGLWRWKESSRARKRRRKCGPSRSGSGRSSESRRTRFNGSDVPTIGASAAYATCSDFPMPGTDSSGELFLYGDSGGINWDSELTLSGQGVVQRIDGVDVLHAWIVSDSQSLESGYGSEPGYRGDGELGYGDDGVPDDLDEEDREQLRLGPWSESSIKKPAPLCGIAVKIAEDEDVVVELKMQHRLRRRRQESRPPTGHKSRPFV